MYPLCRQFGFDAAGRRTRLGLLGLGEEDGDWCDRLQDRVIAPQVAEIGAQLYDRLLQFPACVSILRSRDSEQLRRNQRLYLLSLGRGYTSAAYFEERLRVGLAHARAGVPLSLYECAYSYLRRLIIARILERDAATPDETARLLDTLTKITALDMSLAIDACHQVRITALESSLEHLAAEKRELRQRVATDALTRLASHSEVLAVLHRALISAQRKGTPLCIGMLDLDHFKVVNDTYGHLVGDAVLRDTAARMQAAVRGFDTIGRYGGEEFLVVFEDTAPESAHEIMERLRIRVTASPIHVDDLQLDITVSGGIACHEPGDSVETLLNRADAALYTAKRDGRNQVRDSEGTVAR